MKLGGTAAMGKRRPWVLALVMVGTLSLTRCDEDPVGHMQVLGSHRPASVSVTELNAKSAPTPQEFYARYVKSSTPAIFRSAVKESAAFRLWSDGYIREHFGNVRVRIESYINQDSLADEKYKAEGNLRYFIDGYHEPSWQAYVISPLPVPMYGDVGVPPSFGACGEMSKHVVEVILRLNGGGNTSPLHKERYNQIKCLFNGTQRFKLIENKYEVHLCDAPAPDYVHEGFTDIDAHKVDLKKYPGMSEVEWSNLTLNAGDCLFLPQGYYHHVHSYGTHNLEISTVFGRFDGREALDFSDCDEHTDQRKMRSLNEFQVQWPWSETKMMVVGKSDLEDVYRVNLVTIVEDYKRQRKQFTYDEMKGLYALDESSAAGRESFKIADKDGDGILTLEEVEKLGQEELRQFVYGIETQETQEDENYEYYTIPYQDVRDTLKRLMDNNNRIEREVWTEAYKKLGGSGPVADEVFSRLSGSDTAIVSERITDEDIGSALSNWMTYWSAQYSPEERGDDVSVEDSSKFQDDTVHDYVPYDMFDDEIGLFDVDDDEKDEL